MLFGGYRHPRVAGLANPKPKTDTSYKYIVYAALISGAGHYWVLAVAEKEKPRSPQTTVMTEIKEKEWKDWRNFIFDRKVK